jgi:hypothetical protein
MAMLAESANGVYLLPFTIQAERNFRFPFAVHFRAVFTLC